MEHAKDQEAVREGSAEIIRGLPEIESEGELSSNEITRARLHLETAIELTEAAAGLADQIGGSRADEEWRLWISNSLAYYLAERGDQGDRVRALGLVREVERRIGGFPDAAAACEDTIRHVKARYPAL